MRLPARVALEERKVAEPDWNDFRIFHAVAVGGSVAAAARELGIDNSTVSRRLSALEEMLGADLCLRTARGIVLTNEGQAVLVAAQSMSAAVTASVQTIATAKTEYEGVVRVTCVNSMVPFLAPLLNELRAKYPDLRVLFTAEDTMTDLAKGGADIAVRMVRPREIDLIARKGVDIGWSFYAAQNHAQKMGVMTELQQLKAYHLIPYTDRLRAPAFTWYCDNFSDSLTGAQAGSPEAALLIASQTDCVAFVPCAWADMMHNMKRVFDKVTQTSECFVVYHETQRDTLRVKAVADAIVTFLKDRRAFFAGDV